MLMVLRYQLFKVDTINDFSHQHLFKTEPKNNTDIIKQDMNRC